MSHRANSLCSARKAHSSLRPRRSLGRPSTGPQTEKRWRFGRSAALLLLVAAALFLPACTGLHKNRAKQANQPKIVPVPIEELSPLSLPMPLRRIGRPRVALVLGSGGTRGIAHVGVIRVLREAQIPIDLVVGSSVGSIVGALYCAGTPQEKLEQIALTLRRRDIFDFVISRQGVLDGTRCEEFIAQHIGRLRFVQLSTPLAVVSTEIETGQEIVIARGDVARAVRASCTFPGLVVPIRIEGRLLVDGGVVDKLPVSVARKLGADIVIAVDVTRNIRGTKVENLVDMILQTVNIMGRKMTQRQAKLADVLIRPNVGQLLAIDLQDAQECIDAGVQAATRSLPTIRAILAAKSAAVDVTR